MNPALVQQILALLPIFYNFAMVSGTRSWLANAVYFMRQPTHEPYATVTECGIMESCYQVGRFVFAVPGGVLVDKYGRKYVIMSIGFIQMATWVLLSLTRSIEMIFVIRFFHGCASALSNSTGPNAIGELCSPKYRGLLVATFKSAGTVGILIECILASISSSYTKTVYATTILSLFFFITIPFIVESPYYLMNVSKHAECKSALEKLRKGQTESEICAEYEQLKESVEHENSIRSEHSWLQYMTLRSTRKPLISCILLNALVFANGTNVIFLYVTVIFPPNEYFSNKLYPLILSLVQLGSTMSAAVLIDALPRRQLFMLAGFLSFLIQSFNGLMYYEYTNAEDEAQKNVFKWCFLVGGIVFWVLANTFISPLNMTVKSEILPISIRGLGNSICLITQSLSTIICYRLFSFVDSRFGTAANYAIFAVNSFLLVLVVYFHVPETRGKTLAEVQMQSHKNKDVKKDSDTNIVNNKNNNKNLNNNNNDDDNNNYNYNNKVHVNNERIHCDIYNKV